MDNKKIRIGTKVMWRGCFGNDEPAEAVVTGIEESSVKRSKYGESVQSIGWDRKDYGCYTLDNGHWCYGDQITHIVLT